MYKVGQATDNPIINWNFSSAMIYEAWTNLWTIFGPSLGHNLWAHGLWLICSDVLQKLFLSLEIKRVELCKN